MRYVVLLVVCLLSACATSSVEPPEEAPAAPLSSVNFGISLNRASLTSHDFEKYKLLPAGLFVECGTFYRGRPETTSQAIEQVGVESLEEARRLARLIIESYSSNPTEAIDAPGGLKRGEINRTRVSCPAKGKRRTLKVKKSFG